MSVRAMLTLSIIRDIHTKLVDFFLAYTQTDVKTDIFMEFSIGFGFDWAHTQEWVTRLDKQFYGLNDAGLERFEILKKGP